MPVEMRIPRAKAVDMNAYARKPVFQYFRNFDVRVNSRTVQLDVSETRKFIKDKGLVFSISMTLLVTQEANDVAAFRHRIVKGEIEEYDFVFPLYSVLTAEKSLSLVRGSFSGSFGKDYADNLAARDDVKAGKQQAIDLSSQGYIIVRVVPWYSFTAVTFPYSRHNDSVPQISIGKFYEQQGATLIPIAIQTNHALVDGYHVGLFLDRLSIYLADPERYITPMA